VPQPDRRMAGRRNVRAGAAERDDADPGGVRGGGCGVGDDLSALSPNRQFTGFGTYQIVEVGPTSRQRMVLDLTETGSGTTSRFDSGQVPGGSAFPRIDIDRSLNGFYCSTRRSTCTRRRRRSPGGAAVLSEGRKEGEGPRSGVMQLPRGKRSFMAAIGDARKAAARKRRSAITAD
jgi:hypothetical protein